MSYIAKDLLSGQEHRADIVSATVNLLPELDKTTGRVRRLNSPRLFTCQLTRYKRIAIIKVRGRCIMQIPRDWPNRVKAAARTAKDPAARLDLRAEVLVMLRRGDPVGFRDQGMDASQRQAAYAAQVDALLQAA